jgi:hypothetical protein
VGVQVGAELPIDSDDADNENKMGNGKTLLYVFERGYNQLFFQISEALYYGYNEFKFRMTFVNNKAALRFIHELLTHCKVLLYQ